MAEKHQAVIMEIRPGVGGEEAALFVKDLFHTYFSFAQKNNWQIKVLNLHPTDLGGFKEIIFVVTGKDVLSKLQFEAGVHRVQRIPETERSGRVHTSTVSVAVLPKPQKADVIIKPQDLKIETFRSSGPGGQYVNKRETAVRITHLPSGLTVTSQTARNQAENKENALSILEARLLEKQKALLEAKVTSARQAQIGKAKRAEKIRTYNFPQNRLTDHRIGKSWQSLKDIMEGNLEKVIEALQQSGHQ